MAKQKRKNRYVSKTDKTMSGADHTVSCEIGAAQKTKQVLSVHVAACPWAGNMQGYSKL